MPGLRAFRNADARSVACKRRHFDFAAQSCRHEANGHTAIKIVAVALKDRVLLEGKENIQIAGRSAVQPALAFAGQTDARSFFHTRRNFHRQRALLLDLSNAAARFARMTYDASLSPAFGAGALDGEEALRGAHFAVAAASRTGLGLGACLCAGALAFAAGDRGRNTDFRSFAAIGVLQRDFHVVAQ